jgi:glucose-1-phosphate thymidylyltransferase
VKAILLAAGYATRLYPLTETVAKPLLPVGGERMIDRLVRKLDEVPGLESVHVVTNAKFAPAFAEWAGSAPTAKPVHVHDDGTTSNDDRLGAIGDIQLVVDRAGLAGDDLLVVAGDNLFDDGLREYVEWWHGKRPASAVAVHDVGDHELATQYAVVGLDDDDRIVTFVEKPPEPPSTLAATATYLYDREHVPLVRTYLDEGNTPDAPGNFLAWLHSREAVYGYRFTGEWMDIGDHAQLLEADNSLRRRAGLDERPEYRLDTE